MFRVIGLVWLITQPAWEPVTNSNSSKIKNESRTGNTSNNKIMNNSDKMVFIKVVIQAAIRVIIVRIIMK